MAGVEAKAGGIEPEPTPQGAAVKALAGGDVAEFRGVVGQGEAGDKADFRGVVGTGQAGQLSPLTVDGSAQVINDARVNVTLEAAVSVDAEVIRAPFSLVGIAEQLASDPEYHRRLALFVAAELAHAAVRCTGRGNADQVIKTELLRLERGFATMAAHIAAKAYDKAAEVVVSLRDGLIAFHEHHTQLVDNLGSLAAVSLSTYVILGQLSVPVVGVLVSASVVKNEKLADLLKFWKD